MSKPGKAVESKTTPSTPLGFEDASEGEGRGIKYPKPLGWICDGRSGKTRETTPTVVRGLTGRVKDGIRVDKAGTGMEEMIWDVLNEPDLVLTWN